MKAIDALVHIGITVADLERSMDFYCKNFGMVLHRRNEFPEAFFAANKSLYNLEPMTCKTAVLKTPNGIQLELFHFSKQMQPELVPWNRAGITHFALTVGDVTEFAKQLKENGVEFCMDVGTRPDKGHWLFVRDPDGNMIEIMEPFAVDMQKA